MPEIKKAPSFLSLFSTFSAPLTSVILMMGGTAFFTTFVSLLLNSKGYSKEGIGFIQAAHFLGMCLGAFQMEKVIRRVGHIQALIVFGSIATSSILMLALYQSIAYWVLLRFMGGLSMAALYIVTESWMLEHSDLKTRGSALSLYMIAIYLAQGSSQYLLNVVDIHGLAPYIVSALFTSLSIVPVGLSTSKLTLPGYQNIIGFRSVLRQSPFGVAGCLVSGLMVSAIYTFFPLFALNKSIPVENLMMTTMMGGLLLQWPIGKLSDYFERRRTLFFMVALSCCSTLAAYYAAIGMPQEMTLLLCFLVGGLSFSLYPLSLTQVCDNLSNEDLTKGASMMLLIYGMGSIFGPILVPLSIQTYGMDSLFLYFSALLLILGGVGVKTMLSRPIVPFKEQNAFVPLPVVTPIAYEMDPRSEEPRSSSSSTTS